MPPQPAELSPERLETAVRRHLPEIPGPLRFQRIPTGRFNASWFVAAPNGPTWVLRVAPPDDAEFVFYERGMMRQEPEIHAIVRRNTTVPVPRILAFDDTRSVLDRDFLIMERLPGRPLAETPVPDIDAVLHSVGQYLAQVHAITAGRFGYLGAHHPMPPAPAWHEAFRYMWNALVSDVLRVGGYTPGEAARLRTLLDRNAALFHRPGPARLLHMDVWSENILVDQSGRVTGLIDWDRALWGDPEIEFAVLDYCGITRPAFWKGYGKPPDNAPAARRRRLFYLLYEMQKYIVIRAGRDRDPAGAARARDRVFQLLQRAFP